MERGPYDLVVCGTLVQPDRKLARGWLASMRSKGRRTRPAMAAAGKVEFVSSDQANCPVDNKLTASIFNARAGITGLETLVASFYTDRIGRVRRTSGS